MKKILLRLLYFIIVLLIIIFLYFSFGTRSFHLRANSNAMYPTIPNGVKICVLRGFYSSIESVDRFDVVCIHKDPLSTGQKCFMIRRIVGLPNETVSIDDTKGLLVNNESIDFPEEISASYQFLGRFDAYLIFPSYKISPVTLKGDEFFVLADSHTNSIDSRIFSAVKFDEIVGRVKGIEDGGK